MTVYTLMLWYQLPVSNVIKSIEVKHTYHTHIRTTRLTLRVYKHVNNLYCNTNKTILCSCSLRIQGLYHLSSCHSAMCLPGVAITSFQWRNSSPEHCPHKITWPNSRLLAWRLSLTIAMFTAAFLTWEGSTLQERASLKIGEQLWGFFLVLILPKTLSPPKVIQILACASVIANK